MRTDGVPPMRSSVENAKPLSLSFSRTWVTSTQASACFDRTPISYGRGPSAHRSASSASSASPNAVQSLVSTWIDIRLPAPGITRGSDPSSPVDAALRCNSGIA